MIKIKLEVLPDFKYEEADIVEVNNASNGFTKELFYSYNQFLKTKVKKISAMTLMFNFYHLLVIIK